MSLIEWRPRTPDEDEPRAGWYACGNCGELGFDEPFCPKCGEGAKEEIARLSRLLNTPETADFVKAVTLEAAHQRERWGASHDGGKTDADWFWLIGYLAGKAIRPDTDKDKKLHRIITVAAAACNWHAAVAGTDNTMRPGTLQTEEKN